jgi:hypothetical protein
MEQQLKELTVAITEVSNGNFIKDYILPLLVVLFAGTFAHFSTAFLRYRDAQKEKLQHANDWILGLQTAFNTLITIKRNYHGLITSEPLNRACTIPQVIMYKKPIQMNVSKLSFITLSAKEFTGEFDNHRNLSFISSLQENYNVILSILEKRNALLERYADSLDKAQKNQNNGLSLDDMEKIMGSGDLAALVDMTEALIQFTDDIIIAIHNFLCEFPDICRLTIDIQRIKNTGNIVEHFYDNDELLQHSPRMNAKAVANILSKPEMEVKFRYIIFREDGELVPLKKSSSQINDKSDIARNIERYEFDRKVAKAHCLKWL